MLRFALQENFHWFGELEKSEDRLCGIGEEDGERDGASHIHNESCLARNGRNYVLFVVSD